jgi:integrase
MSDASARSEPLERTPEGHKVRLRYGKNLRARFLIRTFDEDIAERRAKRLRELAASLARSGHSAHAFTVLTEAAGAQNERDFAGYCKVGEDLCGASSKPPKVRATTTFEQLGEQWTSGKLHREWPDHVKLKKTADTDEDRLEKLYKVIGPVALINFTLEDAERAMASLDDELASGTRRHYAQLISKLLRFAVYPCKIIERSPLPTGFLPAVRGARVTAYLYPDEDAKLMACTDVPIVRRLLYGFLAREGLRISEALGLRWKDVDLVRGVVTLDKNKTDDPRAWALSPGVAPALEAFRDDQPSQAVETPPVEGEAAGEPDDRRLFEAIEGDRLADTFRGDLQTAGVKRAELFPDDEAKKTRRAIRVHDLRATFVTLSLASDRTEAWVADRTGHKSSVMINRYRRQARQVSELSLGRLAPLDRAIPEFAGRRLQGGPKGGPASGPAKAKPTDNANDTNNLAPVAQWKSGGFLIHWSGVRIPSGALIISRGAAWRRDQGQLPGVHSIPAQRGSVSSTG